MNIHEYMAEQVELAAIYAHDGAFRTAATILEKLGQRVRAWADECDAAMFAEMGEPS